MEFIIEHVTEREMEILERIDANWWPNDIRGDEAVIEVEFKKQIDDILSALGRK